MFLQRPLKFVTRLSLLMKGDAIDKLARYWKAIR